jgi:hypothetical protein
VRSDTTTPDLPTLLDSWEICLRAARKSPPTVKSYLTGVRQYLDFCADHGRPATLDRRTLDLFVDHLLSSGAQPATAVARQLGVRRFSAPARPAYNSGREAASGSCRSAQRHTESAGAYQLAVGDAPLTQTLPVWWGRTSQSHAALSAVRLA